MLTTASVLPANTLAKQWCKFSAKRPGTQTAISMEGPLNLEFEMQFWAERGFTEVTRLEVKCG